MKKQKRIQNYLFITIGVIAFFAGSCSKDEPLVKTDPVIIWADPADITVGTLLTDEQLNATANVTGIFVYTPSIGTGLDAGANQELKVDFTPADLSAYNSVSQTVKINVIANIAPFDIQLVNIPAGTFTMGSSKNEAGRSDNENQNQVTLSAFRMSKYEITNAQYAAFLNANNIGSYGLYAEGAYPAQSLIYPTGHIYNWGLNFSDGQWVPVPGYENHPVMKVTWYGATEFAAYAGGALPTEAQWEYACRAGTGTSFNTGDTLTHLQANFDWDPYNDGANTGTSNPEKTQAVGTYPANAWGLHDMHGNVWEWCSDWYGPYPTKAQTNPTGGVMGSNRVIRGGSWYCNANLCRSAQRYGGSPDFSNLDIGFRIVLNP